MHIRTKIDLRKYFMITFALVIVNLLFARNRVEIAGVLIFFIAVVINNLMLVEAISELIDSVHSKFKKKNFKIINLFLLKLIILFGGLALCIHFMGKRVIIPLISYFLIIFVLAYCRKKQDE